MADLNAPTVFAMACAVTETLSHNAKETLHIMVQTRRFLSFLDLPDINLHLLMRWDCLVISIEGWEQNVYVLNPQALVKSKQVIMG